MAPLHSLAEESLPIPVLIYSRRRSRRPNCVDAEAPLPLQPLQFEPDDNAEIQAVGVTVVQTPPTARVDVVAGSGLVVAQELGGAVGALCGRKCHGVPVGRWRLHCNGGGRGSL